MAWPLIALGFGLFLYCGDAALDALKSSPTPETSLGIIFGLFFSVVLILVGIASLP